MNGDDLIPPFIPESKRWSRIRNGIGLFTCFKSAVNIP